MNTDILIIGSGAAGLTAAGYGIAAISTREADLEHVILNLT